jgi:WD40 repeat protein
VCKSLNIPVLLVLVQVSQGCAALQIQGVHAALSTPNKSVIAACPTSQHLVAAAANSFVVIYDTSTPAAPVQKQQLRSTTSNQSLQCLAWSYCGTHLAGGESGSNATVFVWDVNSGRCQQELKTHKTTVGELCFSPNGKWS